jgi:hypothetical protein
MALAHGEGAVGQHAFMHDGVMCTLHFANLTLQLLDTSFFLTN